LRRIGVMYRMYCIQVLQEQKTGYVKHAMMVFFMPRNVPMAAIPVSDVLSLCDTTLWKHFIQTLNFTWSALHDYKI